MVNRTAEREGPAVYPWYAIGASLVAALAASILLATYAGTRAEEAGRTAAALQDVRLHKIAFRAQGSLAAAIQLARVGASLFTPLREQAEIQRDLLRLLSASDPASISGVGVFYAPYAFKPGAPLEGYYCDRGKLAQNSTYVLTRGFGFDYTRTNWYIEGRTGNGRVIFTAPYFAHGHTFVSAALAFYAHGKLAGVMLVDAIQASLTENLRSNLLPGDAAYVTDEAGRTILNTQPGSLPSGGRRTVSTKLAPAPWTLHLSSDFSAAAAAQRRATLGAIAAILLVWIFTAAIVVNLIRVKGFKLQTIGLKRRSLELQRAAYHDALTGLPNRAFLLDRLREAIRVRLPDISPSFAVLFIDLDQFAVINDSLGHATGDQLLQQIAQRITEHLPPGATLARLGGDEFVIFVTLESESPTLAHQIADRILEKLRTPFTVGGRQIYTGASIGLVFGSPRYVNPEELIRDADIAMYRAKEAGRSRFVVFDEEMHDRALERLAIENDLRSAIEHSEFSVSYQPIVHLQSGEICAVEALCRWRRRGGEEISPADFIPIAEQTGAIAAIDSFVLRQACRDATRLATRFGEFPVAVNVSATRLTHSELIGSVSRALLESGLPASSLKLEITETAIMAQAEQAIQALGHLRDLGVSIVIDDFGTGYSSLSYVQRLPISGLKIDRSFITPVAQDRQSEAIVRAVVGLAKSLGVDVTAEGVETAEQLALLTEIGVDYAQGFILAPAVPFEQLDAVLEHKWKRSESLSGAFPSFRGTRR